MHPEGIPLHMGINYVISPSPEINKKRYLTFQQELMNMGIDYSGGEERENEIFVVRKVSPLEIRVISMVGVPVGQLLILAPHPNRDSTAFGKEVEAIVEAFEKTWVTPRQILSCDSTIRYLYETSSEHAFKELWETRLRQSESSLAIFGRRVLGGGLRFVMPPIPGEDDPTQIEVKIEAYLQDTKKIFIEADFKWPQPKQPGVPFEPMRRLQMVDKYIENEVRNFVAGGGDDEQN